MDTLRIDTLSRWVPSTWIWASRNSSQWRHSTLESFGEHDGMIQRERKRSESERISQSISIYNVFMRHGIVRKRNRSVLDNTDGKGIWNGRWNRDGNRIDLLDNRGVQNNWSGGYSWNIYGGVKRELNGKIHWSFDGNWARNDGRSESNGRNWNCRTGRNVTSDGDGSIESCARFMVDAVRDVRAIFVEEDATPADRSPFS